MRFMKLYSIAGNNKTLESVAEKLNHHEYAYVGNDILDQVCTMLAEAEVYHLLTERGRLQTKIEVFSHWKDYEKRKQQLRKSGIARDDFSLTCLTSGRPLQVKRGDRFEVLEAEDIITKVKFIEGEAQGKSFTLDNMLLVFN